MHLLLAPALAQDVAVPEIDAQLYRAPLDPRGTTWAEESTSQTGFLASLGVGFLRDPFVWVWEDNGERVAVVSDALGTEAGASYGFSRFRAGIIAPFYPVAAGEVRSGGGLGDVSIAAKASLLEAPLGLAVVGRVHFPTATTAIPLGADGLTWELTAVADRRIGNLLLALNLGERGTRGVALDNIALSDFFVWRAAAGWGLAETAGVSLDVGGQFAWGSAGNAAGSPVEAIAGGWVHLGDPLVLRGGFGRGLSPGIGAPAARVLASLEWRPTVRSPEAEPVAVVTTERPAELPLIGTPGRAAPGIVHVKVTDAYGEPLDATWTFAEHPTLTTTDGLGIARVAPGTWTIVVEAPGFVASPVVVDVEPGMTSSLEVALAPALVTVTKDKILVALPIKFDGTRLDPSSYAVLDEVAALLQARPEIRVVRIEGHTDSRGPAEDNLTLSGARAANVMYFLVEKGIEPNRFVVGGYGEARPLDWADNEAAWARNRRIEFVIVEWAP